MVRIRTEVTEEKITWLYIGIEIISERSLSFLCRELVQYRLILYVSWREMLSSFCLCVESSLLLKCRFPVSENFTDGFYKRINFFFNSYDCFPFLRNPQIVLEWCKSSLLIPDFSFYVFISVIYCNQET